MPRRSTVELLPEDIRKWLDKILVERAFGGYDALAAELTSRGYTISRSALQRHGQKFEAFLEKVKAGATQAAAIAMALPDDGGQLGDAVTQLLQAQVMELVIEGGVSTEDVKFTDLISSMAKLNATGVQQKKWASEVKAKVKATAESVGKELRAAGLTDKVADDVRRQILGIVK